MNQSIDFNAAYAIAFDTLRQIGGQAVPASDQALLSLACDSHQLQVRLQADGSYAVVWVLQGGAHPVVCAPDSGLWALWEAVRRCLLHRDVYFGCVQPEDQDAVEWCDAQEAEWALAA